MTVLFKRTKENFICDRCGCAVTGNGYTNHCPGCLTSKHVDINPGDRASTCRLAMPAVGYEIKNGDEWIIHKCACGHIRKNKVSPDDNRDAVIALSSGTLEAHLTKKHPK